MVYYNYVVDGEVVEERIPYPTVLLRTGLIDQVGLTEQGYVEYFEPQPVVEITKEQIYTAIRYKRYYLLQESDWTQLPDSPLNAEQKASWVEYRQDLRDITEMYPDVKHPDEVIWPTKPV